MNAARFLMSLSWGVLAFGSGCRAAAPVPEIAEPLILLDGPGVHALVRSTSGPVVVVNLWATWCEPCKEEFPMLLEVARKYESRGVSLHFVSMDFASERSSALAFLQSQRAPLPSYAKKGKDDPFINAVHPDWSGALPATFVYGSERNLRYFWEGKLTEARLQDALDTLLAELASRGSTKESQP